jgi:glucose/arabinose dehydrogenase
LIYRGEEFRGWGGNLLVSSLGDMSIRRLQLDGSRVVYDERIYIGERVRDLILLPDGKLLMSFDNGKIGILSLSKD